MTAASRLPSPARGLITECSRWAVLAILIACPWPWGCVLRKHRELLAWALIASSLIASLGWLIEFRRPRCPLPALLSAALLLAFGWGMCANPKAYWEPSLRILLPLQSPVEWLPGTLNQAASQSWMLLFSGLFGLVIICSDLAHSRIWRARLWNTLALSGFLVAAFGLIQRSSGAAYVFWTPSKPANHTFFGPFVYHGNAASFLLLPAVLAAARALYAILRDKASLSKLFWTMATLTTLTALMVNTSRAGAVLGISASITFLFLSLPVWPTRTTKLSGLIGISAAIAAIAALGIAIGWDKTISRLSATTTSDLAVRFQAAAAALPCALDAGTLGFGTGSFPSAFRIYQQNAGLPLSSFWKELHCDPVQAVIEWGWLGFLLWLTLFPGALLHAWRHRRPPADSSLDYLLLSAATAGLLCLFLNTTIDFPLQVPSIMTSTAALTGLLWGLGKPDPSSLPSSLPSPLPAPIHPTASPIPTPTPSPIPSPSPLTSPPPPQPQPPKPRRIIAGPVPTPQNPSDSQNL
jgi:hypothetical protein